MCVKLGRGCWGCLSGEEILSRPQEADRTAQVGTEWGWGAEGRLEREDGRPARPARPARRLQPCMGAELRRGPRRVDF